MPINIFNKIVNYIAQSFLRIGLMMTNQKTKKRPVNLLL